jgi:hypothetical protein
MGGERTEQGSRKSKPFPNRELQRADNPALRGVEERRGRFGRGGGRQKVVVAPELPSSPPRTAPQLVAIHGFDAIGQPPEGQPTSL